MGDRVVRLILVVYDALRTFDRPCTRAELEAETGLSKDDVWTGLKGLMRRRCLRIVGEPRQRTTFQLVTGATRPYDLRGMSPKSAATRGRISAAVRVRKGASPQIHLFDDPPDPHRAACPPSHNAEPGALRVVRKGSA